ncbi:MAG: SUMF1/EgtB/PvdO family nonheme iron enzyme [Ardenticatenales bacterium]|nr:SUMF1/EgtB/PvdO family nonheme iron enzyme [Ardenticatenales bacterium]
MSLDAITDAAVRQALRSVRHALPFKDNALLGLDAVVLGLRAERMPETAQSREWMLGRIVQTVVWDEMARLREGSHDRAVAPDDLDAARETALIEDAFRIGNPTLECWSALYARYLALRAWQVGELADLVIVNYRTLERRVTRGYALLAQALRDAEIEAARHIDTAPGLPTAARIIVSERAPMRGVPEARAALLAAVTDDARVVHIAPGQIEALAQAAAPDVGAYRLGRIAEWSQPRFRLDERFVDLSLLVDMGEDVPGDRWHVERSRFSDLRDAMAEVASPCLVVLGSPGSGKSTLLRRLELDLAVAGLRDGAPTLTFFIPLSRYQSPSPHTPPPAPRAWLGERWSARFPALPPLDDLLEAGRMVLLLDALNEMPHADMADYRERVRAWRECLHEVAVEQPGNRVVFSCRSLDYSAPLSSPTLPVPQLRIEPMSDERMARFLRLYSPARGEAIWRQLQHSPQHGLLRTPYFLSLLAQQVETDGRLPEGHAALFTGYVRQVLQREVERGHRLFAPDHLLTARDCRRTVQRVPWRSPFDLPEHGPLIPRLSDLAYEMQRRVTATAHESSQVSAPYDLVVALLDHPCAEDIVLAGVAMSVLDEDMAGDEVMFFHQLLQEYFAARRMADGLDTGLVSTAWRADAMAVALSDTLAALAPSEPLPPPEPTGWEETAVLAAAMSAAPAEFVRTLAEANLPLAARCAAQVEVRAGDDVRRELAWQLVRRSRDPAADLRARIAAGMALGDLGDPRFERRVGPHGHFLLPPRVAIPGGSYPIGSDDGPPEERPRHLVELAPFHIGLFPVTNAEWACFMVAGGYEDERWWDTRAARAWQEGEGTAEGLRWEYRLWRRRFVAEPGLLAERYAAGRVPEVIFRGWQARLKMTDPEFEAHLLQKWPGGPKRAPECWQDAAFAHPAQPVVGVSWFEARAYGLWLTAQTGTTYRLPTEAEWEAVARGASGRRHAYGEAPADGMGNTTETHVRRPAPVGTFPDGDTPEGAADMAGNVYEWTSSLHGRVGEAPAFPFPYRLDAREDGRAAGDVTRVVRGGAWSRSFTMQYAARRVFQPPAFRGTDLSLRLAS